MIKSDIILIRGNSSSGKTTLAKRLAEKTTDSMLISQDVVRRDMLHEQDSEGVLTSALILELVAFGVAHNRLVILEGIFRSDVYFEMLTTMAKQYNLQAYYLDVSLDETYTRNMSREVARRFERELLERWYRPFDIVDELSEQVFGEHLSVEEMVNSILNF